MNSAEMDYYSVLNVKRCATKEKINLAYRKLAIQLCPNRDPKYQREFMPYPHEKDVTHLNPLPLNRQWAYINMAYDVLGNDLHRAIYDRYGEAGLFQGIMLPNGYFPPYQYHGDHMKVYEEVMGTASPYANLIDAISKPPLLYSTKTEGIGTRTRDPPVEKVVALELEEVRFGCVKLMHVMRQEFCDKEETRTEKRKKVLKLNIAPGVTPGTRYCFKEEGDRSPTKIPADIVFITADKPHPKFKRRNFHDLVYTREIPLGEALSGVFFTIKTLDKRTLKVVITDIIHPGYTKIIPNEGLPKCKMTDPATRAAKPVFSGITPKDNEFGNLIVEFNIRFPKALSKENRLRARRFFEFLEVTAENDAGPDNETERCGL